MNFDFNIMFIILTKSLYVLIVIIGAFIVYKIVVRIIRRFLKRRYLSNFVLTIAKKIFRYIVIVAALIVSLQVIGVNVISLWAIVSATIAAVAIGFVAFWSVISNSFCTLLLLTIRPFKIGDKIELFDLSSPDQPVSGLVININMIYTIIKEDHKGKSKTKSPVSTVKVPNNFFFQKILRVYNKENSYELEEQITTKESLILKH